MRHKTTILIVDDEVVSNETLGAFLLNEGYQIVSASNGEEALEKSARLMPDLILLDVMMPDINGFEVCQRLRIDPLLAEVPIIMITALDDREARLRGIEVGADDFIVKPFDRLELKTRVKSITRLNRYRRLLLERGYRQDAEEELQRRNRELTLLNRVLRAVSTSVNKEEILYIACEALAEAFELSEATALFLNEDRTQFSTIVEYTAGGLQKQMSTRPDESDSVVPLVGHLSMNDLLSWKTPVALSREGIGPALTRLNGLMQEYGVDSLLIAPILIRESVIGVIELKAVEQHRFSDQDLALSQSVATAIAQALETADVHHRLQHQVNEPI